IDGSQVAADDAVIGLTSSGPHSNGYSLIRKLLEVAKADADTQLEGRPLIEQLLIPTRIYVRSLLALMRALPVHACAHITGGGLTDNIPRMLPDGLEVRLQRERWPRPAVFEWLARTGGMDEANMHRTFNCGIGMVVIVAADQAARARQLLEQSGERATLIGQVQRGERGVVFQP
ncbi:MAG: phosphoribosylformylglycinamidine cyclo-ligase, partial [Steroidobacteraceae bacterium]